MKFRKALNTDVFQLLQLYQRSHSGEITDPMFRDYRILEKSLEDDKTLWILAELGAVPCAALAISLDFDHYICKIFRMFVDQGPENSNQILRETLKFSLKYIKDGPRQFDIVYTTTVSMTLEQQSITLEEGFKILGVFPNLLGEDTTNMNGVTAYFFDEVLEKKRQKSLSLHPTILPFYENIQEQCDIDIITKEDCQIDYQKMKGEFGEVCDAPLPILELIVAENFVLEKFMKRRGKGRQLTNFYPFYRPNCMITDPKQQIEIYIQIRDKYSFAAIIGEHLERNINPVELYKKVQMILKEKGVSYIEIINDASDIFGVDCILQAEFTPCAYFPAFKRQGQVRRDYVIFGKSFEYLCRPSKQMNETYNKFYQEYFKIEGKNYFPE